ncbi:transposase [Streptomyces sp. NBC_00425]|uniref:transposase n=1 Tax=Streptomyces sp. NBC_00425 TaxID=2975740 RepID=UPI003FCD8A31
MDDDLWTLIEPLLPPWPERSPGPRPVADRLCLQGILYVLHNGIAWQLLPLELGFGSGQTCWRRLERWQQAGVFDRLHRILLAELNAAGELDWPSRARQAGPAPRRSPAPRRPPAPPPWPPHTQRPQSATAGKRRQGRPAPPPARASGRPRDAQPAGKHRPPAPANRYRADG